MDRADLRLIIDSQSWTNAKTYEKIAPHEYFMRQENTRLYLALLEKLQVEGVVEEFRIFRTVKNYTYWYDRSHKYWIMGEVVNRVRVEE